KARAGSAPCSRRRSATRAARARSEPRVEAHVERAAVDVVHRRVRVDADVPVLRQLPENARLPIEEIVHAEERVDPLREAVSDPDVVVDAHAAGIGAFRERISGDVPGLDARLVAVLGLVDLADPPVSAQPIEGVTQVDVPSVLRAL